MKTFIRHIGRNTQKNTIQYTKKDYNMTRQCNAIFYNTVVYEKYKTKYKYIYFVIAIL